MKLLFLYTYIGVCLLIINLPIYGQVTFGSGEPPEKAALLEVKSQTANSNNVTSIVGGILLPRVQLEATNTLMPFIPNDTDFQNNKDNIKDKHTGLTVYNLSTQNGLAKALYTWDGTKWVIAQDKTSIRYFYPPAFNLPLPRIMNSQEPALTFDLYEVYEKQFNQTNTTIGSYDKDQWVTTNTSIERVPSPALDRLYTRTELDYAIIYYDKNIIYDVSINNQGVMSYRVKDDNPGITSFINLVFVIK